MEFTCECCHYTTTVKCNYDKHISSNKHIIQKYKQTTAFKVEVSNASERQTKVIPETTKTTTEPKDGIFCKYCNKEYKHKSSLSKHIKSCKKSCADKSCADNEYLNELNRMNQTMEDERKEFQKTQKIFCKQIDLQSKQIEMLLCMLEIHTRQPYTP
jgi:hypothetical protein